MEAVRDFASTKIHLTLSFDDLRNLKVLLGLVYCGISYEDIINLPNGEAYWSLLNSFLDI